MKRKINRVGQNTLTVSLPNKWVKQMNLKQGDEVEVKEYKNTLMINVEKILKSKREIVFDLEKINGFMLRLLCGPYIKGYNSIIIYYENPIYKKSVQNGLKYLIGFEIVEHGKNYIKLEEISIATDEKFLNILFRLFFILKSFLKETRNALINSLENLIDLNDLELTLDRLALYSKRLMNTQSMHKNYHENSGIYHVICLIEQATDELQQVIEYFEESKPKKYTYDKNLDFIFDSLLKIIDITLKKLINYLEKRDYNLQIIYAKEQKKMKMNIKMDINKYLKMKKENVYVYWHLINISEHLQHMSEELF
jgi:phosphate uptake regulator